MNGDGGHRSGGHGDGAERVAPCMDVAITSGSARISQTAGGGTLKVRQIESDDFVRLGRLFTRLSPRTIYLRFFNAMRAPSEASLHHLADVDHEWRQALVAEGEDHETVGVARYDRDAAHPDHAEVAIVVEDAWQGQGLGKLLLASLAREGLRHGVSVFTGNVLGENERMLTLARHLNPQTTVRLDHGEWRLEIPLEPIARTTAVSSDMAVVDEG